MKMCGMILTCRPKYACVRKVYNGSYAEAMQAFARMFLCIQNRSDAATPNDRHHLTNIGQNSPWILWKNCNFAHSMKMRRQELQQTTPQVLPDKYNDEIACVDKSVQDGDSDTRSDMDCINKAGVLINNMAAKLASIYNKVGKTLFRFLLPWSRGTTSAKYIWLYNQQLFQEGSGNVEAEPHSLVDPLLSY